MKNRIKNIPLWGMLTIWLVMAIGLSAYNWFLVCQDEATAPREQVVLGSIYRTTHWKQDTAFYSFTYAGRNYKGSEMVRPDKMYIGDVAVYFDPEHPSLNTLVEFHHKSRQDHGMMVGCGYASVGLAALLACVLAFKKVKERSVQGSPQHGNLSNT
jgi:hypothetical protein